MAHSSIKPIWKYSWKPEGYGIETVELNTSSVALGSLVKLDHSFFRGKEFSASVGNVSLTVGQENQTLTGKEDIVLRLYDAKLSQLGDSAVFKALEIVSKRAKSKELTLKVNFIADAIDPTEFGQNLNQEADVVHNTLEASTSVSTPHILVDLADIKLLQGEWGKLSAEEVNLVAPSFKLNDLIYEKGKIVLENPLELEVGGNPEKGFVRYNPNSYLWEIWNVRSKKFVPIIISHNAVDEIPVGSIPIVTGDDPAAQSYVDWLVINSETKTLSVPYLASKNLKTSADIVEILTELQIMGHTFRAVDENTLDIDNLIQIDKSAGTVKICGLAFDVKLINALKKIEARMNSLEKKINEGN